MTGESIDFVDFETLVYDRLPRLFIIAFLMVFAVVFLSVGIYHLLPPDSHAAFGVMLGILAGDALDPVIEKIKTW